VTEPARAPAAPVKPRHGTLAAVVGSIVAAGALFTMTPHEESGRKVEATVTADGAATIRHVSGPRYLSAYLDIVKVPTACDGITKGIRIGQRYTDAQCTALLERELVVHAEGVIACVPQLYGRTHQVTAAVLLAYNIGVGGFCKSTAAKLFRVGRWREGCAAFARWNRAGGAVVRGLTLRREREMAECVRGLA
jgi:GH24 family phage-related lysozyme (muramidase)